MIDPAIASETARRRTFAIISHPDAGKTTLTEKLLLYGGAIGLAGSVTASKRQRDTSSDWMELEKKRGISISSTVLQFDYDGFRLNLLDTPGHKDFSEDTYRVLMAVDAVVMVIDAGKGIETQTKKLFEICRKRGIPIFTFMNKLDRPSRPLLGLMDELEKVLSLKAYPINWPLGNGPDFKGVYDRRLKQVHMFERLGKGAFRAPVSVHDLNDPFVKENLHESVYKEVVEELEILDATQGDFDLNQVLAGKQTPVFFWSAANNFGVELLLRGFLEYSTGPSPRHSLNGLVEVACPDFSAFVFKVQTNMNPMHRDKVVFVRICSGKFTRNMVVKHSRTGEDIKLSDAHNIFGRDREIVNEAYPGDIVGFVTKNDLRIGDTITEDMNIVYGEIPVFAPESFAFLENAVTSGYKAFRKGMDHLLAENIVQSFQLRTPRNSMPLLGAVGPLQYEVLQYRLKDEYGADSNLNPMPWKILRWVESHSEAELIAILPNGGGLALDDQERLVMLFPSDWSIKYFKEIHPNVVLADSPAQVSVIPRKRESRNSHLQPRKKDNILNISKDFKNVLSNQAMLDNLTSLGYLEMTPIQEKGLPLILSKRDFIGQANTGSGKTAAFALGILSKLDLSNHMPQALVLVPTRELAEQVANEIRRLARFTSNIKVLAISGGSEERHKVKSLKQGAHIIVGTPGRITKLLETGIFITSDIKVLVLDEADRLLEMGTIAEINHIASFIPVSRQTMLFSATFPHGIKTLSASLQEDAAQVTIDSQHQTGTTKQFFFKVEDDKNEALLRLLGSYCPESCIIFCNSREACNKVSGFLRTKKIDSLQLHSDLEQADRTLILIKFDNKSCRILVATDLASRGLDIKDVSVIINYDLPSDHELYVHRIGRTGRAGQEGLALSLYTHKERAILRTIAEYLKTDSVIRELERLERPKSFVLRSFMSTIYISGGRKDNIRPGDILGALTKEAGLKAEEVGKIHILEVNSYVAITHERVNHVIECLNKAKIKGKKFRVGKAS